MWRFKSHFRLTVWSLDLGLWRWSQAKLHHLLYSKVQNFGRWEDTVGIGKKKRGDFRFWVAILRPKGAVCAFETGSSSPRGLIEYNVWPRKYPQEPLLRPSRFNVRLNGNRPRPAMPHHAILSSGPTLSVTPTTLKPDGAKVSYSLLSVR